MPTIACSGGNTPPSVDCVRRARVATLTLLPAGLPFGWRGTGVVLALVLGASFLLEETHVANGPTVCWVRRVTGVPCPGCGLTRSFVATAHLDFAAAFAFHPFGPLVFLACILGLAAIVWRAGSGHWPLPPSAIPRLRATAWGVVAVWLGWAAVRAAFEL